MHIEIITIPLGFDNCYILRGDGVIAVDAGQPGKGKNFLRGLEAHGINPGDIALVVLTHGHWDHIGSASEIKSLTGATLAMHKREAHWLENSLTPLPPGITPWGKVFGSIHRVFMPLIRVPPVKVDLVLTDEGLSLTEYGIAGRVIHTPGHSSGSVTVLLDSGEAFVGDLAMNRFPLRLSPGLPVFAEDPPGLVKSWDLLLKHGASMVYPAHGKPFPATVMQKATAGSG